MDAWREGSNKVSEPSQQNISLDLPPECASLVETIFHLKEDSDIPYKADLLISVLPYIDKTIYSTLWAFLHEQLGDILSTPEYSLLSIDEAIACYDAALTIFTRDGTYPAWKWAHLMANRAFAYFQCTTGSRKQNLEQALADYNAALTIFTPQSAPEEWARIMDNRGLVYYIRIEGNQRQNLEQAIEDYTTALTIRTLENSPNKWAQTLADRGQAYIALSLLNEDQDSFVKQALKDFNEALTIYTYNTRPYDWAHVMRSRGRAYQCLKTGERKKHQEYALDDFTAALTVFKQHEFPVEWAQTLSLRGIALSTSMKGDKVKNQEQSLTDITAAIMVFIDKYMLYEAALGLAVRAEIYGRRIAGHPLENEDQAFEDYTAALSALTPEEYPYDWATILVERARMRHFSLFYREGLEREHILADCTAALMVFTPEEYPYNWASTLLTRAEISLSIPDRKQQVEQTILIDIHEALSVLAPETTPDEWIRAHIIKGDIYRIIQQGDQRENLQQALKNYDIAWRTCDQAISPQVYHSIQLKRAKTLKKMKRWAEAHQIFNQLIVMHRDSLTTAISDTSREAIIADHSAYNLYVHDAFCRLYGEQPDLAEVILTLEEGRAQSLRIALELDALIPDNLTSVEARTCAEAFMITRDQWREAQLQMNLPLPPDLSPVEQHHLWIERMKGLQAAYKMMIKWRAEVHLYDAPEDSDSLENNESGREENEKEAHAPSQQEPFDEHDHFRKSHYSPDFLKSKPTLEVLAHSLASSEEVITYLLPGEYSGAALSIQRDEKGTLHVDHLSLPNLTEKAIEDLVLNVVEGSPQKRFDATVCGGLILAQNGTAFFHLQIWASCLSEAAEILPPESSFQEGVQSLLKKWANSLSYALLIDTPFADYTEQQLAKIDHDFNEEVLRIELDRSLRTLGEIGLGDLALSFQQRGIRSVTFIPFGHLALFPFSAVVLPEGTGEQQRLGDLFDVAIAPSAYALAAAYQRMLNVNRSVRPFILSVGDPQPLEQQMSSLEYAQAEAETTRKLAKAFCYPSNSIYCVTREKATKKQVIYYMQQAWFAQLATHGHYIPSAPRQSKLFLAGSSAVSESDRTITLADCLDGHINLVGMRLLILSGCETSMIAVDRAADEMMGLATGFLQAGVGGVIASLWAVDDRATYLLMNRFVALYLDPSYQGSPARALGEAQRWLREEATNRVLENYEPIGVTTHSDLTMKTFGRKRSTRHTHFRAVMEIRTNARQSNPDTCPYAHPIYWAAFRLMGC